MMEMTDYMFRIGCAFLMGALIGLERQFRQHNAGLRTNILVALASAAFTVLSVTMTTDSGDQGLSLHHTRGVSAKCVGPDSEHHHGHARLQQGGEDELDVL